MDPVINAGEQVADMGSPGAAFVSRATDPAISNVSTPIDFAAQFPTPLDPTEVIAMCEEVNLLNAIPEKPTGLQQDIWRELNELAFTSGSNYIAFADGACPEEYYHDGDNTTLNLKNIGAKKSLTESDIIHSRAVSLSGSGIRALLGGWNGSAGMPGGADAATFGLETISDLKEKEVRLGMTLVLNGEDRLLAVGNASSRPLEFSGIETQVTSGNGAHVVLHSGTFSAANFDAFLAEACAKPTHIFGHPQAIQGMMSGYFQLGFQGSQLINFNGGDRIVPGFSFAGFVQTGVGRLTVVADSNFTKSAAGTGTFHSKLYPMRMSHNGVPLVYRPTQIPLHLKDLAPGCTAISFEVWKKTALTIKAMCAQNMYEFDGWTGRYNVSTCSPIG